MARDSRSGLGASLVAFAIGHHSSVRVPTMQSRWRFSQGTSFLPLGLVDTVGIVSAGAMIFVQDPLVLVPCVAGWCWSHSHYGRAIERGPDSSVRTRTAAVRGWRTDAGQADHGGGGPGKLLNPRRLKRDPRARGSLGALSTWLVAETPTRHIAHTRSRTVRVLRQYQFLPR